jgi:uncharacterized protein (UPF0332 family)
LDRRFYRLLVRTFSLRQVADYDAQADPDADEVRHLIEEGNSFLNAARGYLATPRESDHSTSDSGASSTEGS